MPTTDLRKQQHHPKLPKCVTDAIDRLRAEVSGADHIANLTVVTDYLGSVVDARDNLRQQANEAREELDEAHTREASLRHDFTEKIMQLEAERDRYHSLLADAEKELVNDRKAEPATADLDPELAALTTCVTEIGCLPKQAWPRILDYLRMRFD